MFIQALFWASFLPWAVGLTTEQPQAPGRSFRIEIAANGTPSTVYKLWSTEAGVKKWFAPDARIDARVGGATKSSSIRSQTRTAPCGEPRVRALWSSYRRGS